MTPFSTVCARLKLTLAAVAVAVALYGGACTRTDKSSVPAAGGACRTTVDCPGGQFCERPLGQCDAEGKCMARPEMCTQDYNPVCGCDDQTYSNACGAHAGGTSVKAEGACT